MVHGNWAPNTLVELTLLGRCQGQAIVNVHHFEASGAAEADLNTDGEAQAFASDLAEDWRTNLLASWRGTHPTDYFLDGIRAQVIERPGNFEHRLLATDNTTGLPAAGTEGEASDDLTSAAVIRWRSVVAGRHNRGRTYVGPLTDGDGAGGVLAGGKIASVATYAAAMITRYTGTGAGATAGYVFTVYSRPYSAPFGAYTRRIGGVLTIVNDTTDYDGGSAFITTQNVDSRMRSQRRREIGVGA